MNQRTIQKMQAEKDEVSNTGNVGRMMDLLMGMATPLT